MKSTEVKEKIFNSILKEMPIDPVATAADLLDAADCLGLIDSSDDKEDVQVSVPDEYFNLEFDVVRDKDRKEFIANLKAKLDANCDEVVLFKVGHSKSLPDTAAVMATLKNVFDEEWLLVEVINLLVLCNCKLVFWHTWKSGEAEIKDCSRDGFEEEAAE
jgi:hypothetical protein